MNYIAHIQLAAHTQTSLLGNFLGDFVKGNQHKLLPTPLKLGVILHRKIDQFTDSHKAVMALRKQMPSTLRRMSGVILDIYFDHLLCLHWHHFSQEDFSSVTTRFYTELHQSYSIESARFNAVKASLLNRKWLITYFQQNTMLQVFKQIEARLNYRCLFAQEAYKWVCDEHGVIESSFLPFYNELQQFAKQVAGHEKS